MVSIIVPNYNHRAYLKERLDSIFAQTYQNFEVIILDDCSTDNSKEVIELYRDHPKVARIEYNEKNSGSTFHQWKKGIGFAKGEYIWIAESDDVALPTFLETLTAHLYTNENVGLVYCNSLIIDENGNSIELNQITQTPKQLDDHFAQDYCRPGRDEVREYMMKSNTIANASAVVFRKSIVKQEFIKTEMKVCGDWYFWIQLLLQSEVFYSAYTLNHFRTHSSNVRTKMKNLSLSHLEDLTILNVYIKAFNLKKHEVIAITDNLVYRYVYFTRKKQLNLRTRKYFIQTIYRLNGASGLILLIKSSLRKTYR